MADKSALKYAKDVKNQAEELYEKISLELSLLNDACQTAKNTLDKIDDINNEINQYADELSEASNETREFEKREIQLSKQFDTLKFDLMENVLTTTPIDIVDIVTSYEPQLPPLLPDFSIPDRSEMEKVPLVSLEHNPALWDELTEEFTTFEEELNHSLQEIEQLNEELNQQIEERQLSRESVRSRRINNKIEKE